MRVSLALFFKYAGPQERKKFFIENQGYDPKKVEMAYSIDPKAMGFLLKMDKAGEIDLEFGTSYTEIANTFKQFRKLLNSPNFKGKRDLNQYTSWQELENTLGNSEFSKNEIERQQVEKGIDFVYDDGEMQIIKLTTSEAISELCKGTGWCTKDPELAQVYLKRGPLYITIYNSSPKLLFSPNTPEIQNFRETDLNMEQTILMNKTLDFILGKNKDWPIVAASGDSFPYYLDFNLAFKYKSISFAFKIDMIVHNWINGDNVPIEVTQKNIEKLLSDLGKQKIKKGTLVYKYLLFLFEDLKELEGYSKVYKNLRLKLDQLGDFSQLDEKVSV